ncbi:MAG: orotidine-5'-phosphate decarboxylase [Sandaracinaceae bacterium]|nr:orotidine-5'-phosphate decarboxylase [Sandaracinaceae bacterium]
MSQVHGSPHAPSARERLVLPLDVTDLLTARRWIDQLAGEVGVFKVGLELFTAAGPDAVRAVHDAGAACFLDLKLHDIPATMAKATASAARLGVRFLTVHAVAGPAALRAVAAEAGDTTLLAVTVLTSMDDDELETVGLAGPADRAVERLGGLSVAAGVGGLVCSPLEVAMLRERLGTAPTLMVPGVRPAGAAHGDQKRIATPGSAIEAGADFLVVGRPIRDAADPVAAARAVVDEMQGALARRSQAFA